MKTYLFPEGSRQFKANLHCHTTVSDGRNTPSEMKDHYKSKGYSVLAMTDHELLVDHSDLDDPDFLTVTGFEYAFCESRTFEDWPYTRTMEFNLFAKDQHNVTQPCFDPEYVIHGEKWRSATVRRIDSPFERKYTIESMQHVIDCANANGFLVSLNHPHYSMESPAFFGALKGLFAMEILNQGSYYVTCDYNPQMYDQMLNMGHRIACIAADDSHVADVRNGDAEDPRPWGFTMILAEKLDYQHIIKAIEKKSFYASNGPIIDSLCIEDGVVRLECSPAKVIVMHTKGRHYAFTEAPLHEYLTRAEFRLPDDEFMCFEVIDEHGFRANTRAYFLDELEK